MTKTIMTIAQMTDAGDLTEMLEEVINTRHAYADVEIDQAIKYGDGKTIAQGHGHYSTLASDKRFSFEINLGTHKDAVLVFDPLEVIIEVYDDE